MADNRLYTLDGMRGLAAVGVVLYHLDYVGFHLVRSGYLAVDFFFALSGLVVAMAYEDRLLSGAMRPGRFMLVRFVRLYPLYLVGTVASLILLGAGVPLAPTHSFVAGVLGTVEAGTGLMMLPDPWSPMLLYPFNIPAWSLMYELAVNLLFAMLLVRVRTRWLLAIWLCALAVYAIKVNHAWLRGYGSNLGPYWAHISAGVPRVIAAFSFGIILKRRGMRSDRRHTWMALVPVALLVTVLLSPSSRLLDLATIGVLIPACIWAANRFEFPARMRRACALLGDLSYPLYAIHFPIIFAVNLGCRAVGLNGVPKAAAIVIVALLVAWLLIPMDTVARRRLMALIGSQSNARDDHPSRI